jgi:hypothetical protein
VVSCAEQAQPPIAIAKPSIVPLIVFMLSSSRIPFAVEVVIGLQKSSERLGLILGITYGIKNCSCVRA